MSFAGISYLSRSACKSLDERFFFFFCNNVSKLKVYIVTNGFIIGGNGHMTFSSIMCGSPFQDKHLCISVVLEK